MTPVEQLLRAARERISKPERWTRKAFAKDVTGLSVPATRREAVCWCAVGALDAERAPHKVYGPAFGMLLDATGDESVADFNDSHTHAEVLAAFDAAIAKAADHG